MAKGVIRRSWKRKATVLSYFVPNSSRGDRLINPTRVYEVLAAVRDSGGSIVAVSEEEIVAALGAPRA